MKEVLAVKNLSKNFGLLAAVSGVNLSVSQGERRAIIGPNGAGKTTFFNLISGALLPTSGRIELLGREVTGQPDWKRVRQGLARTFQRNNLFMKLTVMENIQLAVQNYLKASYNIWRPANTLGLVNKKAENILEKVGLASRGQVEVTHLSYGEQRQLEVALALATEPSVLLLDEPTAGMSSVETSRMVELLKTLPLDLTLLIVEHDMDVVFEIAEQITVFHYGKLIAEGNPGAIRQNTQVREIYFGA